MSDTKELDIEEKLAIVREILVDVPKSLEFEKEMLARLHQEQQDLLHTSELVDFNASGGYTMYKYIQRLRRERRKVKNNIEVLEEVAKLSEFKKIDHNAIGDIVGRVRNVKNNQKTRGYRMRVREDLQEIVDNRRGKLPSP